MRNGSYSKLKAQRTDDVIYMGLDLPHHSNRHNEGKAASQKPNKEWKIHGHSQLLKKKPSLSGVGCGWWGGGGTTVVFIQKAKYFLRENAHLSALPLHSEHLDTSTFHRLNKTPTTVHQIKLKGLHGVCAVWTPPPPQSAARCPQRSIVLTVPAHAHSLLKTLHCSYWKTTSSCLHIDLSFSFFSFN